MGEVWKAHDPRLDREVAIKVSGEQFSDRFEREARAIAALNHPHICQIYDVGPNYLVMELVQGTPLIGPLAIEKVIEYARQILDALDAAHRKGITHRDLKPANILVTRQGIKLLDFGLAKQDTPVQKGESTVTTEGLTEQGQILGTLQYMAPEQLQGRAADARSDLFGFGCVLYEMLTGNRAFDGGSPASVIAAILEREPAPLPPTVTGASPSLERVLRRALAKDPEQRFQTARDLKAALLWAFETSAVPVPLASARRQWWLAPSVVAMLVVVVAGWAFSHFRSPVDRPVLRVDINPPAGGRFVSVGIGSGGSAVSPDGKTVAFVASVNGKSGLWVRPLEESAARLLLGTEGASDPFWSPDGKSIGFFGANRLQRIDLIGGSPLTICDVQASRGGAWGADGRIIFGTLAEGLYQVSATGGKPSVLTQLDTSRGENTHRSPQMLPGGRFLYFARSDKAENTGVYVASFANPAKRALLLVNENNALYAPDGEGGDYLLWVRGGTLLAQEFDIGSLKLTGEPHAIADPVVSITTMGTSVVSVSASGHILYSASGGTSQMAWVDRMGRQLGTVGEAGIYSYPFRLSPDGRRVVLTRDRPGGGGELWVLDVDRPIANRLTSKSTSDTYPIWSPDGRTIVFSHSNYQIFRKDVDGVGEEQLVEESPNFRYPNDWSRDGRFILNQGVGQGQIAMGALPVTAEGRTAPGTQPLHLQFRSDARFGRFSPEQSPRWIAFQSKESGQYEVYIQRFPNAQRKVQVSSGGGLYPQWNPGGKELFYLALDNRLMVVDLNISGDEAHLSDPRPLIGDN